jgi:hypothetical protein
VGHQHVSHAGVAGKGFQKLAEGLQSSGRCTTTGTDGAGPVEGMDFFAREVFLALWAGFPGEIFFGILLKA